MLSRVVRASVLTLSAALALAALSGPPASAAPCPSGQVCMTVIVDDQNLSVPAAGNTLYLTLFGAGQATLVQPDGDTFSLGTSVPLSQLVLAAGSSVGQFTIQTPQVAPLRQSGGCTSPRPTAGRQPAAGERVVPLRLRRVHDRLHRVDRG